MLAEVLFIVIFPAEDETKENCVGTIRTSVNKPIKKIFRLRFNKRQSHIF
jgi:hypothetical protein